MNNTIPKTINIRGELVSLEHPLVMGILNITPDSFYDKSRNLEYNDALNIAIQEAERR